MSRARVGSFSPPTSVYGRQLSVVHPPDNNFEVVASSPSSQQPNADQTFADAIKGTQDNEIAILFQALADAQATAK